MSTLKKLEGEIRDLEQSRDFWMGLYTEAQAVLDLCPGGLPGGTGIFTPEGFIRHARHALGYAENETRRRP